MMAELPYRDQRRQRIANHWQSQPVKPAPGERGQLEGKLHNAAPGVRRRTELTGEGKDCEDGNRERAVFPVAPSDGNGKVVWIEASSEADKTGFRASFD